VALGSPHLRSLRVSCCCYWVQDIRELSSRCTSLVSSGHDQAIWNSGR